MRRTYFANVWLDAVWEAEAAVLGTVVASVRIQPADGGAHGQSQMKKMREKPRVVDIGGGGNGAQRDTLGRDHDMILGPRLTPICGVAPGQLAAVLGPHRTTVDHHVP